MSLYRDAVAQASVPSQARPLAQAVRVTKVMQTPAGTVIAGEIVEGEYLSPREVAQLSGYDVNDVNDIGWGFKKLFKGVAKGIVKVADPRTHLKLAKFAVKTSLKVANPVNHFRVLKATGKIAYRGTKAAVKYVKKNPLKSLALAVPGAGLAYLAYKGVKKIIPSAPPPQEQEALPPEPEQAALPPMEPEPEQAAPEEAPPEEGGESQEAAAPDEGQAEGSEESENTVQGETTMSEEYVGLDEIAGEEIGAEEWVGDDDIGAAPRSRGVMARRAGSRPAAAPSPGAVRVKSGGYTKHRRQYLPIASSGTVAAAASATITIAPQTLFRGRRLVVPSAIAASFTIDDIKVGNTSQGAAAGSVPAEAFLPTATGEDNLQMDTANPGKTVTLLVTNTSGGALQFRAVIFGDSVQ